MYSLRERCDELVSMEACELLRKWVFDDILALGKVRWLPAVAWLFSICAGVVGGVGSRGGFMVVDDDDDVGPCGLVFPTCNGCIVPTMHKSHQGI